MASIDPGKYAPPSHRSLQVFAFDPSLNTSLDTAVINSINLKVPWEPLSQGPVGEYLEVVDVDPASGLCYPPVNLNDPYLLAQDGLSPSEGTPQFHQQMVYAVASTTIQNFEDALGRRVLWAVPQDPRVGKAYQYKYLPRLRIYPHALREANAYYSPQKKAVLFGYFPASEKDPGNNLPGGMVFTCLSHDVVAHEVTHALLESLHPRFIEPSNVDVLALHEAFADIVALFQHFSHPEVLRNQISRTRGDLESENLLGELAQQFGQAIGGRGALRSALGEVGEDGIWHRLQPDPLKLRETTEPHARGAILLAAIFDTFITIYKARIADLLRIATGGSGVLPPGEIHPDLVVRLADEAAKSASHVLSMCIRALDYVPPVDITFGEYLRAIVTADADMVPDDTLGYRIAVVEAFRRHGIYPLDVRSLSEESLRWNEPTDEEQALIQKVFPSLDELRKLVPDWGLESDRKKVFDQCKVVNIALHKSLVDGSQKALASLGLILDPEAPRSIFRKGRVPTLEIHSARPAYRVGPNGLTLTDLVIEVTQRRRGYLDPIKQSQVEKGELKEMPDPDFIFRGGTTMLLDLKTGRVRYAIRKHVNSENRLMAQRRYLNRVLSPSLYYTYFGDSRQKIYQPEKTYPVEPFALLHRYLQLEEESHD